MSLYNSFESPNIGYGQRLYSSPQTIESWMPDHVRSAATRRRTSGGSGNDATERMMYMMAGRPGAGGGIAEPSFASLPDISKPTVGSSESYYRAPGTQAEMERLIQDAATLAPEQINAGRALESQQLAAAGKRISRSGASLGANKFARQDAWNRLSGQMAAERGTREADITAKGHMLQSGAVGALTGAQEAAKQFALAERAQEVARETAAQEALLARAGLDVSQQGLLSQHRLGSAGLDMERQRMMWALMQQLGQGGGGGGRQSTLTIEGGGGSGGGSSRTTRTNSGLNRVRRLGEEGYSLTPTGQAEYNARVEAARKAAAARNA